jgi:hypothetical protein
MHPWNYVPRFWMFNMRNPLPSRIPSAGTSAFLFHCHLTVCGWLIPASTKKLVLFNKLSSLMVHHHHHHFYWKEIHIQVDTRAMSRNMRMTPTTLARILEIITT